MIKINNLTKSYITSTGRHYVFKNLNIYIPSKKNIAFIGRNGAGKSTLLRIIGGIDKPDCGKIISNKTISWPVGLSGVPGKPDWERKCKICCSVICQER